MITVPFVIHAAFISRGGAAKTRRKNEASNHSNRKATEKFRVGNIWDTPYFSALRAIRYAVHLAFIRAKSEHEGAELAWSRRKISTNDSEKKNSARAATRMEARVQNFDSAGGGALAQTGDHGVKQAAESGKEKWTGEGDGHALMLEIGFTHRLGMGKEKPREHGQDLTCCGK